LFDNCPGKKATHYFEHPDKGFLLLWNEDQFITGIKRSFPSPSEEPARIAANKLPYPMGWKEAADLAWGWLLNQPKEKYTDYLDHDGSNGKGFLIYNEGWGHVAGSHYAFLGVKPVWAWYGK
jgi:hypothetical protein